MSRPLALLLCLPLIIWLWKRDKRARPPFSGALWISLIWVLLLGSHPVGWWLGIGSSGGGDLEGNSFDRIVFLGLIFASIYVVSKRGFRWDMLFQQNKGLLLFYLFLLVTMLWSPYPLVTFKRWFKDLGAVFVILVILTEQHPLEATKAIFARCAFVWFPLSEIFIRFFPAIGRNYSHSGGATFRGVAVQKNTLGEICMIACLFLISELARSNRPKEAKFFKGHHLTTLFTLAMGLWLLVVSNSKTSLIGFGIGSVIVLSHKIPVLKGNPRHVLFLILVALPTFFVAETLFSISDQLLALVGRDSTLTGRTDIWEGIKQNPVNPLIGAGYMMYWDIHDTIQVGKYDVAWLKTAHNGYIDSYLDGGALGLLFLAVLLVAVGIRAAREFLTGSEYGRLALAFFVVMLLSNISESTYARKSPLWFVFLLFALELRGCLPSASSGGTPVVEDSSIDEGQAWAPVAPRRPA